MADKRARVKLARAATRFSVHGGDKALPSLILMTDDERLADPVAAVRALPRGSMVILRARKDASRAELATALRGIVHARGLKLLIANDGALAARSGADGVHLSEARARDAAHWRALKPGWIITMAAHSLRACLQMRFLDAVLLSPAFATRSHRGEQSLGPARFGLIARQLPFPVYALGGIDAVTIRRLDGVKLAGIAAVGALSV